MFGTPGCCGITRRGLLIGAAAGLAAGAPLGWLAWRSRTSFGGRTREDTVASLGMPGPFPGRVVEVRHPQVINDAYVIDQGAVRQMLDRGMCGLTGSDDLQMAWRRFFERDDVVGVKVNPVGRGPRPGETGRVAGARESISSPAVVVETVRALHEHCGIPKRNIIVFERYANEFRDAGYERLMSCRALDGCRWYASASGYDNTQLAIDGRDPDQMRDPHVVGYDPDQFVTMGFAAVENAARDDDVRKRFHHRDDRIHRSHLSMIVSRMVNKIVTIPCLKDHKSAGVTIALKNMSHGMNNNVARSHISLGRDWRIDGTPSGPNQCNTFIPHAVAQRPLREKAVLHVCDGLISVYEGGPGCWNASWGTWNYNSLLFATDPVAMDHVGWDIIDRKRAQMGWPPVGRMGAVHITDSVRVSSELAVLAASNNLQAELLKAAARDFRDARRSEAFDLRTPQHVSLAGELGLGTFDAERIEYRQITI